MDVPRAVAHSDAIFHAAGVADRATAVGQSFFDALPPGCDLYIEERAGNWPDREAVAILKRCAEAARPNGRVVVFNIAAPGEEASPDLLMLVLVGGKERTFAEFQELAREAGLEVTRERTAADRAYDRGMPSGLGGLGSTGFARRASKNSRCYRI